MVLGAGLPAVEGLVVALTGQRSAAALAPQVSAPSPFGLFHDLRWLAVYHRSWWGFVIELAALLAFRSAVDAAGVHQAWPEAVARPPFAALARRALAFEAFAALALTPWVTLLFALAVAPVSWVFLAAVPPALGTLLLTAHGPASARWWNVLPPWRAAVWMLGTFLLLSLGGAAASAAPLASLPAVAAASGAVNALLWRGVVAVLVDPQGRPTGRARMPLACPLACLALVGVVMGGAAAGFGVQRPVRPGPATTSGAGGSAGGVARILVVAGLGTSWDGRQDPPTLGGEAGRWFSYRGSRPDGSPLPYDAADTLAALSVLESRMSTQVEALHRAAGAPITVVAVSEGALLAKAYAAWAVSLPGPRPPLAGLILVNPVIDPGRVYYPPPDSGGWGVASGWALGVVGGAIRSVSDLDLAPSTGLFRSIVDQGPELRRELIRPLPGVPQADLLALADAVAAPPSSPLPGRSIVSLGFHNGALGDPETRRLVGELLAGTGIVTGHLPALESLVRSTAAAWQVPDLAPSVNPAWVG